MWFHGVLQVKWIFANRHLKLILLWRVTNFSILLFKMDFAATAWYFKECNLNCWLHTVHNTFHFQAKELNFSISYDFFTRLFISCPPIGLHAVNLFATLELHRFAELKWESHGTVVWAFVPPILKPMQLSTGHFNLPVWNISPFVCHGEINLLLQIDCQLLVMFPLLKTSARPFEFHRWSFYTVPPSRSPTGP